MENPEIHKNENDPFDPLTLFGAKRSCGIDYISVHYQRKGQRVKKVMCFSLNRIAKVKLLTCIKNRMTLLTLLTLLTQNCGRRRYADCSQSGN
jgi:hypothetical protein